MVRCSHIAASLLTAVLLAAPALAADSFQPGSTTLIGRPTGFGTLPAQADGDSFTWTRALSADGRVSVFASNANDLGATDDLLHAYARDDQTGAVTLLDRAGPGGAPGDSQVTDASISADGSHACFLSYAGNLVPGVDGQHRHLYVVTIATGAIVAADRSSGGTIGNANADGCSLDANGSVVAFGSSSSNLVAGVSGTHVYVRHLDTNTTELVDSYQGTPGNGGASRPSIDAGGTTVAFETTASNLNGAGGDQNGSSDIYVRDLGVPQPVLVSRATGPNGAIGNAYAYAASISGDGTRIAFQTAATNLGDGDNDPTVDVHVRDLLAASTTLVSRADGALGAKGDDESSQPAISADGAAVAFQSRSSNLGADPGANEEGRNSLVFLRTLGSGHTIVVSRASGATGAVATRGGSNPSLDAHANNVAWQDSDSNLDPLANGVFLEVFQRHLAGDFQTRLISRPADASGRPAQIGYTSETRRAISADGRFVVFETRAPFGAPAGWEQVYVRDVLLGTTQLVSRGNGADGAPGDRDSRQATISADGTKVAFMSTATNLPGGNGDLRGKVYVRDLLSNITTLVSTGPAGTADGSSESPAISQDGSRVAFYSTASNLVSGDANGNADVFVRDLVAGTTTLASRSVAGGQINGASSDPTISADGTRIGFTSDGDAGAGVADGKRHLYVRDTAAATTTLVDRKADGSPSGSSVASVSMSADGNRFEFDTPAQLTPDATNPQADAYVRDVAAGTTTLVSVGPGGQRSSRQIFAGGISYDGTRASFETYPDAFTSGDPSGEWVRDLTAGTTTRVNLRDGTQVAGDFGGDETSLDADGNCVAFRSQDSSLGSPSYAGHDVSQLWLHTIAGECPVHAPDTTITSGPDGKAKVREEYSVFGYRADESGATFTCSLDGAPKAPCGDAFHTGRLRDGVHRFAVAAKDRAGNTDPTPALVTFTVGVPPRVTNLRIDRRRRLVFKLSEKAKVQVRLTRVGRAHSAAVARLTIKRSLKAGTRHVKLPLKRLRSGRYRAVVTATDAAGNRSVPKRKASTCGAHTQSRE